MRSRYRWFLLCEDRAQERFFTSVGEVLLGNRPLEVLKPPRGEGAAWAWVLSEYVGYVRRIRRRPTENVALVAVVDGDNEGFLRRKQRFDEQLAQAGAAARGTREHIAVCVPTWSIETWIAHLSGWVPPDGPLDERRSLELPVKRVLEKRTISLEELPNCMDIVTRPDASFSAVSRGLLP